VSLVDLCVRRPVFATMLVVSLVVLGLASYRDLGFDIFPKVDIPTVTVTTHLPGASPEEVESQITKRIEEVVNTISGIDELRSITIEGQGQVFVSFILDRDIETAAQDVREKVATILSQLPQGTEAPVSRSSTSMRRPSWPWSSRPAGPRGRSRSWPTSGSSARSRA
jgi:HAE1 family hydrophobic/amphiphilic exporter-1